MGESRVSCFFWLTGYIWSDKQYIIYYICLCWFVCQQNSSKNCWQILTHFFWSGRCMTGNNWLDFAGDLHHNAGRYRNSLTGFYHHRIGAIVRILLITLEFVDKFLWNIFHGWDDLLATKIWFMIRIQDCFSGFIYHCGTARQMYRFCW